MPPHAVAFRLAPFRCLRKCLAAVRQAEGLAAAGVGHKLWVEQPENIPTALATFPVPSAQARPLFKKCQLYRG